MNNTGIVFLTGAGFDGSIWQAVTPQLTVPFVTVNYPERHNGKKAQELSFDRYIESALRQIESLKTEKVIIVGHSIGGVVMMRLGELLGGRVVGRVAIAAAIPHSGGSFLSCLPQPKRFIMGVVLKLAGTEVPSSAIRSGLCSDLSDEQAQKIVDGFTAESRALYETSVQYTTKSLLSLYIVTTKDSEFDVPLQKRMAERMAGEIVEIPSGHLPMISQPEKVATVINGFLGKLQR